MESLRSIFVPEIGVKSTKKVQKKYKKICYAIRKF